MKTSLTIVLAAIILFSSIAAAPTHAQDFFDDFNDNVNTGWTYLDRSAGTTINTFFRGGPGAPAFAEQNQQLEQPVDNYSFPDGTVAQGDTGGPQLGGIALAPGTYEGPTLLLDMISLEPGNGFQDQDIVFGYQDEDNFFYVETIANGGLNLFSVVNGVRAGRGSTGITFSDTATTVELKHNGIAGNVQVTYDVGGAETVLDVTNEVFELSGAFGVGVGSNNDAFAIDNFTVVDQFIPGAPGDANRDGFVDILDYQLINDNLFNNVASGEDGDLDFSGVVDFADFRIWKNAPPILPGFGSHDPNAIPEPCSVLLVGFGALLLSANRRAKRLA